MRRRCQTVLALGLARRCKSGRTLRLRVNQALVSEHVIRMHAHVQSPPPFGMVSLGLSEDGGALTAPARWWLGPPPPRAVTLLTRVLQLAVAALALTWVLGYLGGLGLSPRPLAGGGNDTGPIFNWHPLLLTAAFPLLMAEAVLAYKAPLVERRDRCGHSKSDSPTATWIEMAGDGGLGCGIGPTLIAWAPPPPVARRDATKIYHFALHTAALACTIVGVTAAFVSHTAKRPDPIPNL